MLSRTELADLARKWCRRAADLPRKAEELQALVDDAVVARRHRSAVRTIKRALEVDMEQPANRKGDLPRILGLSSREARSREARFEVTKHYAIWSMMDQLREHSEWTRVDHLEVYFPYNTRLKAAKAVVEGFKEAEIDPSLTVANVLKIYDRQWREGDPRKTRR